jgi:hypothetical protein
MKKVRFKADFKMSALRAAVARRMLRRCIDDFGEFLRKNGVTDRSADLGKAADAYFMQRTNAGKGLAKLVLTEDSESRHLDDLAMRATERRQEKRYG